jgi:DNA-binding NarL/FixJ family response regulator
MLLVRTLLVDDNRDWLAALTALLDSYEEVDVVGLASTGRQALEWCAALRPDLVLMDVRMPEMDGLEAARRLKAAAGAPRVILMTLYALPEYREAALAAGADGLLFKGHVGQELAPLIRALFPVAVGA